MREGLLRRWHRHGDAEHDVYIYSVLAEEFRAPFDVQVRGQPPRALRHARRDSQLKPRTA